MDALLRAVSLCCCTMLSEKGADDHPPLHWAHNPVRVYKHVKSGKIEGVPGPADKTRVTLGKRPASRGCVPSGSRARPRKDVCECGALSSQTKGEEQVCDAKTPGSQASQGSTGNGDLCVIHVAPGNPGNCPHCRYASENTNAMRNHLRRSHKDGVSRVVSKARQMNQTTDVQKSRVPEKPRKKVGKTERVNVYQGGVMKIKKVVRVGNWNVRSLCAVGKCSELAREMERFQLDVVGVTETHFNGCGEQKLDAELDYVMIHVGKEAKAEGGVGLAMSREVRRALMRYRPISDRVLSATFRTQAGALSVIVAYAPVESSDDDVKDLFYDHLHEACSDATNMTIVVGDFNSRIGKAVDNVVGSHGLEGITSNNGGRVVDFCRDHVMRVANTWFPHKRIHQKTWYPPDRSKPASIKDLVLVSECLVRDVLDTRVFRSADIDSDHRLVIAKVQLSWGRHGRSTKQACRYNRRSLEVPELRKAYAGGIEDKFEKRNRSVESVENGWAELRDAVTASAEKNLPVKKAVSNSWITEPTLQAVKKKREAFVEWQKDRTSTVATEKYRKARNSVRDAARADKMAWWDRTMKNMEEDFQKNDIGNAYRTMKRLTKSKSKPVECVKDSGGNVLSAPDDVRQRWKEHFDAVLNVKRTIDPRVVEELEDNSSEEPEPSENEIQTAIAKLRNARATGEDGICAELLKAGGEPMVAWMTELIQSVWRSETIPQEWKDATLVPLFKKKDRLLCDNYRGIALLSVPGKVLTLVLLNRLQQKVESKLLEAQCGFRPGRRTTDQIWLTRQLIERVHEYQSTMRLCFVDLTKAYDSVNREALVAVLRHYGASKKVASLVAELNSGTFCRVRSGGGLSEAFEVSTGVRQGCGLSPLLFLVFMDWIVREALNVVGERGGISVEYRCEGELKITFQSKLPGKTRYITLLYADDLIVIAQTQEDMQLIVDALNEACKRWGMVISVPKTEVMTIDGSKAGGGTTEVKLDDTILKEVESFAYLGSVMSSAGGISEEVEARISKAARAYQIWRKPVFRSKNLSIGTKMSVFRSLVLSILLYGCETWPVTMVEIRKLNTFHRRCIRDIVRVTIWDQIRTEVVLARAKEEPIQDQIRRHRLRWLGHLSRMDHGRPQMQVLRSRVLNCKRRVGGQKQRWADVVRHDLKALGVDAWEEAARDRPRWRSIIRRKPI